MRGAMLHGPGDIRLETRDDPQIIEPTDAIICLSATCICGSDLWPYRGDDAIEGVTPMGHEYCGIVLDVGSAVTKIRPGQFVVGSFWASDGTCELCRAGYQSACVHRTLMGTIGSQESMMQAIRSTRPGGHLGMVGLSHDVQIPGDELLFSLIHLHGGPSPVRRFLPEHMDLIGSGAIQPGKVFDLTLPLDDIAEGYRAMDERRAIKTLLQP